VRHLCRGDGRDLQHDERILPEMLAKLQTGKFDLVAATRYVEAAAPGPSAKAAARSAASPRG